MDNNSSKISEDNKKVLIEAIMITLYVNRSKAESILLASNLIKNKFFKEKPKSTESL